MEEVQLKFYEFRFADGEKAWVLAHTVIEALLVFIESTLYDLEQFDRYDDIVQIDRTELPPNAPPFEENVPTLLFNTVENW